MKDLILSIIFHPVTETVILAGLGIAVKGFLKYKKLVQEVLDVPQQFRAAKDPKSPGGVEITNEEWATIGKEIVEVLEAGAPLFRKKTA